MDLYQEEVMDHYEHPRNKGKLSGDNVWTGAENNASCGDRVEFYLKISKGKITEVKWEGEGCAITTAGASKLSEWLKDKKIEDLKDLSQESMAREGTGIDVNAGRMKCLTLPALAVKKLLQS